MQSPKKMQANAIIFDCDGVLFDSNYLKVSAFKQTLSSFPEEIVNEFINYHIANGGVSRYEKFEIFLTRFLKVPFSQNVYDQLLFDYGRECVALYKNAQFSPGCIQTLSKLALTTPLYVASGSDEAELRSVFRIRKLDKYFAAVFGSPKSKEECIEEITADLGDSRNLVMIGDSEADWLAAKRFDIDFLYMTRFSESIQKMNKLSLVHDFGKIDTLRELPSVLKWE